MARRVGNRLKQILSLTVILILCLGLLFSVINARVVRVEHRTVSVKGKNPDLDGLRILFVSDLKISNSRQARQTAKMLHKMTYLNPDLIIIGGDITGRNLIQRIKPLFDENAVSETVNELCAARDQFLIGIRDLNIPIYAVYGDEDVMMESNVEGVTFLNDTQTTVYYGNASILLAGASDHSSGLSVKYRFNDVNADYNIFIGHDPSYLMEVASTQSWSKRVLYNLALFGHCLDGQVRLGPVCLRYGKTISEYEHSDVLDMKTLFSAGIGTEYLPVRFGTRPTAYLLEFVNK